MVRAKDLLAEIPFLLSILTSLLVIAASPSAAEDDVGTSREAKLTAQRMDVMRGVMRAAKVECAEKNFPTDISDRPLFRYSDPARGYVAAAVWTLGDVGRPKAILVSELIPTTKETPHISFEFVSLTETPFQIKSDDMEWSPRSSTIQFRPIPGAMAPQATSQRRLVQMREFAGKFSASEIDKNERCSLRLLPQPSHRYQSDPEKIADGALFLMAYGTNPELLLLMEAADGEWRFAVTRLSGAETIELQYEDKTVWTGPPVSPGATSAYTGSIAPIEIPGFDRNGRPIRD